MSYCEDPCTIDYARITEALGLIIRGLILYLQGKPKKGLEDINKGIELARRVIEENTSV